MIPRLPLSEGLSASCRAFLAQLQDELFEGLIDPHFATRLVSATDNSVYQVLPQAVVYPKSKSDLALLYRLAALEPYRDLSLTPRGGGTGTNGQSLSQGILVDHSRFMNKILEINTQEGWVKVEPGVVLDQLNQALAPLGYFFAPTLSTSNRATLGGMINTDACGKGSRIYGKTSDHLLELDLVLWGGEEVTARSLNLEEAQTQAQGEGLWPQALGQMLATWQEHQEAIQTQLPQMNRYLCGYNLQKLVNEEAGLLQPTYLLAGSEGTLALVAGAKLKLTPLPRYKRLVLVKYRDFDAALSDALALVAIDPAAVETIDERVLSLAREDEVFYKVQEMLPPAEAAQTRGIALVELVGDDLEAIQAKIQLLTQRIEANQGQATGPQAYVIASEASQIACLWEMRKKGVGLLGNTKGNRKPIAFVEDTAVPPVHLAAYIREFRALLESKGLEYGMFGHVDVGCLHVRPALDLKEKADQDLLLELTQEVAALTQKYGGVLFGEHGRGYRSSYQEEFFGPVLYQELRKIKGVFDPYNQFNPGKLALPLGQEGKPLSPDGPFRGRLDAQIPAGQRADFLTAINCNGNGACYNYNPDDLMCPSWKITRQREQSPKGRAALIREWLRRLAEAGVSLGEAPKDARLASPATWPQGEKAQADLDFSVEVYQALEGCLSCKACATQCPIKVDVPEFKAIFLAQYHQRYQRPLSDYLAAKLEEILPQQAAMPGLANLITHNPLARWFSAQVAGMVDAPKLPPQSLQQLLKAGGLGWSSLEQIQALSPTEKEKSVILLQDAFTCFYEPHLVMDLVKLVQALGFRPLVHPFFPNGKALHVKGFLAEFKAICKKNSQTLSQLAATQIPLVGLDPAVTLTYRDEYPLQLGQLDFQVLLPQEWLEGRLAGLSKPAQPSGDKFLLLGHCTERTKAQGSQNQWVKAFAALGVKLEQAKVGCCGMCGIYGHEAKHAEGSKELYRMSWGKLVGPEQAKGTKLLVTGYSCRSQVKRMEGLRLQHPLQAFRELLEEA